jgi:hypothetical protein
VALFFLSAGLVFILARWFGLRTKHEGTFNPEGKIKPEKEPVSLWPPLMALGLILLLALIFAIYNGLMLAQLARNKDEIPQIIMWLSWLREHQANELIGGALAGIILHEGFRRTQEMSGSSEGALKNSAIVILPAVLFLAVALLSRGGVLERIAGVDLGGVKVTMQPMDGASRRDEISQPTQLAYVGKPETSMAPNLTLLRDLIRDPSSKAVFSEGDMISRDLDIIRALAGAHGENAVRSVESVALAQHNFFKAIRT